MVHPDGARQQFVREFVRLILETANLVDDHLFFERDVSLVEARDADLPYCWVRSGVRCTSQIASKGSMAVITATVISSRPTSL